MTPYDIVIATFNDHRKVDSAVRKLIDAGFNPKNLSVVGRGYDNEEKIIGLYNTADGLGFWGRYGAFWGGLWDLLCGGVFLVIPVNVPVVVLGHLGVLMISVIEVMREGAVVDGSMTGLREALFNYGVPRDSAIRYEAAVKANGFVIVAYGPEDETVRASAILQICGPTDVGLHASV